MKRILLIILKNILRLPYIWSGLCYYARRTEKYPEEHIYAFIRKIPGFIVKSGRVDLRIYGTEKIPKDSGFILFPNHQGLFDIVAVAEACPMPLSVVYKKELKNIPLLKQIFACVKGVWLDRSDVRQSLEAISKVAEEVRSGRRYVIFAEGTRSRSGNQLLDFKGGSFKSAVKAKCPIVPAALIDSYKVFDAGSAARTSVQVHFLDALLYEDYAGMSTSQIGELVKAAIEKAIAENSPEMKEQECRTETDPV